MMNEQLIKDLCERAKILRKHVISVAAAQTSHLGGSLSAADLMAALYFYYLRLDEDEPSKDHFLFSKGHAVHILHACMVEKGKVDAAELPQTGMSSSRLGGHPMLSTPGVEWGTGSLGHALSVGVGIALGERLNQSDSRTVVLMGDGEIQEGSVWEAALSAAKFGLENLIAIVDFNKFQAGGDIATVMPLNPLMEKWSAFQWNVQEIDGHDMNAIVETLDAIPAKKGPTVIIAHTIKGKGVPGVEGTSRAHFINLTEGEANAALSNLEV
jgi:transketolase